MPEGDGDRGHDLAAHDRLGPAQLLCGVGHEEGGALAEHAPQDRPAGPHRLGGSALRRRLQLAPLARPGHDEPLLVRLAAEEDRHVGGQREELEDGIPHRAEDVGQVQVPAELLGGVVEGEGDVGV